MPTQPALALLVASSTALLGAACGARPAAPAARSAEDDSAAIEQVLDDWHAAAAASDEERYFAHLTDDAVFLGTDVTERWSKRQLQAYAHPFFSTGRGWVFRPVRRQVVVAERGDVAWFDEDLEGERMGPARGSGVLRHDAAAGWQIVHYVLSLTIPNERFDDVRCALTEGAAEGCADP